MIKFFAGFTASGAYTGGVGSRISDVPAFESALAKAVQAFDFSAETNENVRTTGQGKIALPEGLPFVTSGVGPKVDNPEAYVLRSWRGEVKAFLRREYAAPAEQLDVIVYTADAYLSDPDVDPEGPEAKAIRETGSTHVVVAVLANAGPSAYGPGRLVANLAGGNRDAETWSAEEIRQKAREALAYASDWSVVSD